jgi:hypothetical protein
MGRAVVTNNEHREVAFGNDRGRDYAEGLLVAAGYQKEMRVDRLIGQD